jgi:hypothetical protein
MKLPSRLATSSECDLGLSTLGDRGQFTSDLRAGPLTHPVVRPSAGPVSGRRLVWGSAVAFGKKA